MRIEPLEENQISWLLKPLNLLLLSDNLNEEAHERGRATPHMPALRTCDPVGAGSSPSSTGSGFWAIREDFPKVCESALAAVMTLCCRSREASRTCQS